ncbi:hypothetical protein P5V15_014585 [Pogonomyrmex californicus]
MSRVAVVTFAFYYALCSVSCLAVTFEDCGSSLGKFTEVSVSNCQSTDARCILTRGTYESISIKFIPNQDISQVNVRIFGVLHSVPIPFPFDKPDVCKDTNDGVDCPLHKDQEYHYTTTLFVQKQYPAVSVDIKWEFITKNDDKIICVVFPAKIK